MTAAVGAHAGRRCAVKEQPIILRDWEVRAVLDGRKTQKRLIVKDEFVISGANPPRASTFDVRKNEEWIGAFGTDGKGNFTSYCPYGKPGDRLWLRENGWEPSEPSLRELRDGADTWPKYAYDADGISDYEREDFKRWKWKRRPSIHMPRWASRITLELTGVRVERLNDISGSDALSEGISVPVTKEGAPSGKAFPLMPITGSPLPSEFSRKRWEQWPSEEVFRFWYARLWTEIHGPGSWFTNPWVWVLEFKRIAESAPLEPTATEVSR